MQMPRRCSVATLSHWGPWRVVAAWGAMWVVAVPTATDAALGVALLLCTVVASLFPFCCAPEDSCVGALLCSP